MTATNGEKHPQRLIDTEPRGRYWGAFWIKTCVHPYCRRLIRWKYARCFEHLTEIRKRMRAKRGA